MKVIAKTSDGKLLIEISEDSFARIIGYASSYRLQESLGKDWNSTGKEYQSDERFNQLQALSSIPNHIKTLHSQLKVAQDALDKSIALMSRSDIANIKPAKNPY